MTVMREFSGASLDNLKFFNYTGKVRFKKKTALAENDRLHAMNMLAPNAKTGMTKTLFNISNIVTDTRQPLLDWIGSMNSGDDNGPATLLMEEILDGLEFLDKEHSNVTEAVSGINRMDRLSKEDLVQSLKDKKTSRMLVNLVDAIIREREKGTFNMDKFIQRNKLLEPGNMCTH